MWPKSLDYSCNSHVMCLKKIKICNFMDQNHRQKMMTMIAICQFFVLFQRYYLKYVRLTFRTETPDCFCCEIFLYSFRMFTIVESIKWCYKWELFIFKIYFFRFLAITRFFFQASVLTLCIVKITSCGLPVFLGITNNLLSTNSSFVTQS